MKVGVRTIHFLTQYVAIENIKQNMSYAIKQQQSIEEAA
jgi:hypothetical protein